MLIEALLSAALFMMVAPAAAVLALHSLDESAKITRRLEALAMSQEGLEAARSIRDRSWSSLAAGTHGLSRESSRFEWAGESDVRGPFTRQVTVSDIDANAKEIVSRVVWSGGERSLTTRLTNWKELAIIGGWFQTTVSDFQAGTPTHVIVNEVDDGELVLAPGSDEGEFISSAFDTGVSDPVYGNLLWEETGSGEVKFQLRTSNVEAGLSSAVWLGHDGSRRTYYVAQDTPIVTTGGTRWIQYRAFFEGNEAEDPLSLLNVTVQYTH